MGNRFISERYQLYQYTEKRSFLILNERGYGKHRLRPYAITSSKFAYRNMFEKKNQSRVTRKAVKRIEKKAARRWNVRDLAG